MEPTGALEVILCDTTFTSVIRKAAADPRRTAHWHPDARSRLDRAVLAISVLTLAEARSGYLWANWGQDRIDDHEAYLRSFVQVPIDPNVLQRWAELDVERKRAQLPGDDNDLWIAATALAHDMPLVTCDRAHCAYEGTGLEVIYLPPKI